MEAGECGRTRGTCFITCRLEVVAVAGLLCFRGVFSVGRIFCVFFFRFFLSFERTRPTASMRPPCLIYVSSSNSVAVFTCAILISCFLRKTTKKTNKNKRFPLLMLICCYCYVFCCRSRQRAVAVQFVTETTVGGWRLRAASLGWVGRVIESWFWPGIFSSVCVGARAAVKLLPNARMLWYLTETSVRIIASWFFRQNVEPTRTICRILRGYLERCCCGSVLGFEGPVLFLWHYSGCEFNRGVVDTNNIY